MKYIGIRGHRGSGKKSIAFLLGNTIDFLLNKKDISYFDNDYNKWVEELMYDEDLAILGNENVYVYYESFSDTLKTFISMLTGICGESIYRDCYKDDIIIDLYDFKSYHLKDCPSDIRIYSREEMIKWCDENNQLKNKHIPEKSYMKLRDFILYFGMDIMKKYLGVDVWIKSLNTFNLFDSNFMDTDYKIFTDVKTKSEVEYLKSKNGIIININRKNNKKENVGLDSLDDNNFDYEININGDLKSIKDDIYKLALEIIKR